MKTNPKTRIYLEMDPRLADIMKKYCEQNGRNESEFIEQAIVEKLEVEELKNDLGLLDGALPDDEEITDETADMLLDAGMFEKKKH